jgi:hypothetical protein
MQKINVCSSKRHNHCLTTTRAATAQNTGMSARPTGASRIRPVRTASGLIMVGGISAPACALTGHSSGSLWSWSHYAFTSLVATWYYKRSGRATGMIRLPGDGRPKFGASDPGFVDTLASVLWFTIGVGGVAFEAAARWVREATWRLRPRRGYRNVPIDSDAQILRFAEENE